MQDKKKKIYIKKARYAGFLLVMPLLLCGCTKKEELLLLSGESAFADEESDRMEEAAAEESPDKDLELPIPTGEDTEGYTTASEEANLTGNPGVIYVHVCGAVLRPGVYELKQGSRVYEAVQEAGGFAEEADQNYVNQAQELGDGIKLVIPTLKEAEEAQERNFSVGTVQENAANAGTGGLKSTDVQIGIIEDSSLSESGREGQTQDSDGRININTASEALLCDIPGIGATRAAAIVAYRESHGGFQKPEDIMKVSGIKEGMYEKIKDSISVN